MVVELDMVEVFEHSLQLSVTSKGRLKLVILEYWVEKECIKYFRAP